MRPKLSVIASAGRLSNTDRGELENLKISAVPDKPYRPEKLLVVTHEVLNTE